MKILKCLIALPFMLVASAPMAQNDSSMVHITKGNNLNFALDGGVDGANGQNVVLRQARTDNQSQQWIETPIGNGYYTYRKNGTNFCIDGRNGGARRQNVYLWTCNANNQNQHWEKVNMRNGLFQFVKRNATGFAIDGQNGGSNGSNVQLWVAPNESLNMQWEVTTLGNEPEGVAAVGVTCTDSTGLADCVAETAASGGGEIVLDAKTYTLTDTLLLESDITIRGQGSSTVITFANSVADTINDPLIFRGRNKAITNVAIEDVYLRCTVDITDFNDQNRFHMGGFFVDGYGSVEDLRSFQHSNISLANVEISHCGGTGLHIKGTRGIKITGANFHDNGWGGVDLWHNMYLLRTADVVITDSAFNNAPEGHGLRLSQTTDIYLEGVQITNNADHGVHMDATTNGRAHDVTVNGNCVNSRGLCRNISQFNGSRFDFDAPRE